MTSKPLVHRFPLPLWRSLDRLRGAPWPYCVVAFHRIAAIAGDELSYPPAGFAELCRHWREHYEILSLDQLLARLAHGDQAQGPTLAITFDDGYADNFELAAPILDRLDLSATFFLTTGAIGTDRRFEWDARLAFTPPLMNWPQVRALHRAGFGLGSHTISHARLSRTRGWELDQELAASRARLAAELGTNLAETALDFAYPFGGQDDCDGEARAAVRRAGYRSCFSCHGGFVHPGDSRFHLRRISVSPRYHPAPRDWARQYARERWRAAEGRAAVAHW